MSKDSFEDKGFLLCYKNKYQCKYIFLYLFIKWLKIILQWSFSAFKMKNTLSKTLNKPISAKFYQQL